MISSRISSIALAALLALTAAACGDPLRDRRIEYLGEDDANFAGTQFHRPGQPCTWCHNSEVGDQPVMTLGGTLFFRPEGLAPYPAGGFVVRLLDSDGKIIRLLANRCGNFWATPEQFEPVYPMRTRILTLNDDGTESVNVGMGTRIGREGSCGACHSDPKSAFSPGVVTINAPDPLNPPAPPSIVECPPPRFAPQFPGFTFE
jgi:hypothetical protein